MKQFLVIVGFCLFKFVFSLVANLVYLGIEYIKDKDKGTFKEFFKYTLNTNLLMTTGIFVMIGGLQLISAINGQPDWIFTMGYVRMILFAVASWIGELLINTVMLGITLVGVLIGKSISRDE